jgi:glycosyltransferase involved in cell wall biosynthesis
MKQAQSGQQRIAYVVSRFPKVSETFIQREMEALERLGWRITVFPFMRLQEPVRQPGAERWFACMAEVDTPLAVLGANLACLGHAPRRLLSLYLLVLRALWRHPGPLARGLVAVARSARWAPQVRAAGISHIHAHFSLHPTVAALALAHLTDSTFSFTCHAQDVYLQPAMLDVKAQRARFVIAISELLRARYLAPLLEPRERGKIHVVRCGVDVAGYPLHASASPIWPPRIVAVARLAEKKGLRYLIDACALLRARGCDVHCTIIGDGPLRERLQAQIAALGLGDCVTLLGARAQDDVAAALRHASVFVQPSIVTAAGDMEGVPVSVMEAMAAGVPVVAAATGAIPELVDDEHTGLLVPPRNAAALAAAIERLARDRELVERLRAGARRRIETEFDLAGNAALLDRYLREAIADGGAAPRGRRAPFAAATPRPMVKGSERTAS